MQYNGIRSLLWGTKHENNKSTTLIRDEIIKLGCANTLILHKRPRKIFLATRKNEFLERFIVPSHLLQILNLELAPILGLEIKALQPGGGHHSLLFRERTKVFCPLRRALRS